MEEEKKKDTTCGRVITNYDEHAYHYFLSGSTHESVVLFLGNLSEQKKVAYMLGPILDRDQNGGEKVTNTVGTFLNRDQNGSQKVTNTVGTF